MRSKVKDSGFRVESFKFKTSGFRVEGF